MAQGTEQGSAAGVVRLSKTRAFFSLAALGAMLMPLPAVAEQAGGTGVLFVANKAEGSVSRVRLSDGREERRNAACETPHELALSPDGQHVAVGCYSGETLEILNARDLKQVAVIPLGASARPHGVVWHENGNIYATAEGRNSLYRVQNPLTDSRELMEFPTGQEGSHMVVVSPDAQTAWTANLTAGSVTQIDLSTGKPARTVASGKGTEGIALNPDGGSLWVSVRGEDQLMELDPATLNIRRRIKVGAFPLRVAVHPDGDRVVTSNLMDGSISVVDIATGQVERTIQVAGTEAAQQVTLIFNARGDRLYVAETQLSKIAEIDFASGRVLGRLAGGVGGDGLAIDN